MISPFSLSPYFYASNSNRSRTRRSGTRRKKNYLSHWQSDSGPRSHALVGGVASRASRPLNSRPPSSSVVLHMKPKPDAIPSFLCPNQAGSEPRVGSGAGFCATQTPPDPNNTRQYYPRTCRWPSCSVPLALEIPLCEVGALIG